MDNTLAIISEVGILIFNVLIFMQLTVLKKDSPATRALMYAGTAAILLIFFVCTYYLHLPEALTSFLCVTIPSSVFYWSLSKYKDTRFFVTFCFLDTVTYIIAFLARACEFLFGVIPGAVGYTAALLLMLSIYIKGKPYFRRYRELLQNVRDGWHAMAVSTLLIYILLVFATAYPKPIAQRIEYIPVFALLSVTILSFYVVFILTLMQKSRLNDLNTQLINEQKWHKIAYEDGLTGLNNRMAYIERINDLERDADKDSVIHIVMIDIDNFKQINDSLGHNFGDTTLKRAAEVISQYFFEEYYETFRIGGDEFALITYDVQSELLEEKINILDKAAPTEIGCSLSIGYARANTEHNNFMATAFDLADQRMYKIKSGKKHIAPDALSGTKA